MPTPLPTIFVLSVKTFADRITHIKKEMAKHELKFEFIFDYDVPEIDEDIDKKYFKNNSNLSLAVKSLTLKHITAWKKALLEKQEIILIFEDDVVLCNHFIQKLRSVLVNLREIPPGYLIFLGGADTKVPKEFFSNKDSFFKLKIPTTEAYITDQTAIQRRLNWLENNQIDLPADHATVKIDQESSITQYWVKQSLVTQGTVFGLFQTSLDKSRSQKSALLNRLIFEWKRFKRRTFPQTCHNIINFLRKI